MTTREQLAKYQADLLDALNSASTAEEARTRLQKLAESADLQDHLGELDPRMLDVAVQLTKKWGVRYE